MGREVRRDGLGAGKGGVSGFRVRHPAPRGSTSHLRSCRLYLVAFPGGSSLVFSSLQVFETWKAGNLVPPSLPESGDSMPSQATQRSSPGGMWGPGTGGRKGGDSVGLVGG